MREIKSILLAAAVAGMLFAVAAPKSEAQVTINVGVAPDCPYGYYGAEWFNGGAFIGVGPWFHGSNDFHGKVDNTFDPQHGYSGPTPKVGEKPAAQRRAPEKFKGNEDRDGRGHKAGENR